MSQKPKTGMPARAALAKPAAPREAVAKAEPVAAKQDAEMDPVVPTVPAEPAIAVPVAIEPTPVAELAITDALEASVPAGPTDQTISAASELAAAPAEVVSATITAAADIGPAVTSEVVETASSIKPTPPTITQGIKSMMKTTEDFVAFGQANLEAFVKSGQIWSAGVQELTKQIATSAKASFDESVSTFKAMSTAKSVKEAIDLQSTFAKAALEKAMAESNKLTDASIKLTEQTLAPITARVTVAVETFGKAA
jgi:phasin family protein